MSILGPDVSALAIAERTDLLELLRGLTPAQWEAPSLCDGWTVRRVATHVVSYDALSALGLAGSLARGRLSPSRANDVVLDRLGDPTPAQVIELVERHREPRGLPAMLGGGIALTDGLIHHQDIRRALGMPREVPAERLTAALDFALRAPTIPARANARGLRAVATDVDWTHGSGPEVTGPGEALLMALAGRGDALADLDGPGLPRLAERVGSS